MSTATTTETALNMGLAAKLRKTAIGAGFAVVLLVPKVLNLRRNEHSWAVFRTVLGIFGAGLVILPLSIWNSYLFAVVGLSIFVAAIMLPPARTGSTIDEKAHELGAQVVVNGGVFQSGTQAPIPVHLFVGSDNLWALQSDFHPLAVIFVPELISARAEEVQGQWVLRVRWADRTAVFAYSGVFAEHLARVAESTVQSVMRPTLPVLPQRSRAANA